MTNIGIQLRVGIKPVNKPTDKVILKVNGTEISQSAHEVVRKLLAPIFDTNGAAIAPAAAPAAADRQAPAFGAKLADGLYAGVTLIGDHAATLILLPGDEKMNWKDAGAWATKQGGELPSRIDALVLFQNLKKEFKEEWYWTAAQYAGNASCAWIQSFGDGLQGYDGKVNVYRVRAVRRVILP